ncbi:hypothetical protein BCF74_1252 [Knoellia remsis]|uniref:Copper(I)-binding protein n=1 Tax=Knoellia remsis TaxID=407159 RepID=A0A2T0U849_9MICO|nr:copper chaperone PCu(A)C [Knoellia remsis]PRY54093.1 hypothetical protein BCF74_1252 [Knoellia remsis]
MSRTTRMSTSTLRRVAVASALTLAVGPLAACGGGNGDASSDTSSPSTTSPASTSAAEPLVMEKGWVKALPKLDKMAMSAMFGVLRNTTDAPVTITAASSPVAGKAELHETVGEVGAMTMRPVKEIVVPAGGTFELKPGANHIMLMELPKPINIGDEVSVELTTSAGKVDLTAPARSFEGANESYQPGKS